MINAEPIPCVGCGYCCRKAPCHWAVWNLNAMETEKCPALCWDGERFRCREAANPGLAKAVSIGSGCCCPLNTDRRLVPPMP